MDEAEFNSDSVKYPKPVKPKHSMRRKNKIQKYEQRELLRKHKFLVEDKHGWAGQHGQHPETEEEEKYHPEHYKATIKTDNS